MIRSHAKDPIVSIWPFLSTVRQSSHMAAESVESQIIQRAFLVVARQILFASANSMQSPVGGTGD